MVKQLKGTTGRTPATGGYDERCTYAVLAVEGFLPGYGLKSGSIMGTAELPRFHHGRRDLALPRPPAMALRDYVGQKNCGRAVEERGVFTTPVSRSSGIAGGRKTKVAEPVGVFLPFHHVDGFAATDRL